MSKRRRKTFMLPSEVQQAKTELDCESDEEFGMLLGVSRDTAFRYRHGNSLVPYAVARLIQIYRRHPELQRFYNPWKEGYDVADVDAFDATNGDSNQTLKQNEVAREEVPTGT